MEDEFPQRPLSSRLRIARAILKGVLLLAAIALGGFLIYNYRWGTIIVGAAIGGCGGMILLLIVNILDI